MKVWEETWYLKGGDIVRDAEGHDVPPCVFEQCYTGKAPNEDERYQLAAAAPDMARVLLSIEYIEYEHCSICPVCNMTAELQPRQALLRALGPCESGGPYNPCEERGSTKDLAMLNVTKVKALPDFRLRLSFSDGTSGEASMRAKLEGFKPLRPLLDEALFRRAFVDEGTVCWPGGLDIAVEQIYALAHHLPSPDTFDQAKANELQMSLAELRRMTDTNQVALAEELGITQGAVSKLEGSAAEARLGTLRKYLAALGWDLEIAAVQGDKRVRLRGV